MKLSSFAGAVALLSIAIAPASAASPMTDAFLANVAANVAFLDQSSRIAADRAAAAPIRDFARDESSEQSRVAEALDNLAPGPTVVAAADGLVTGRSAAVDAPIFLGSTQASGTKQAANGRVPLGADDLAKLQAVSGKAFDDLYWQKQLDALSQIESDYRTYISQGDDPVLVILAKRQLPVLMQRLKALTRI